MQPTYYQIQILLCVIYCSQPSFTWKNWADILRCSQKAARGRFENSTMTASELLQVCDEVAADYVFEMLKNGDPWVDAPLAHFEKTADRFSKYLLEKGYAKEVDTIYSRKTAGDFKTLVCWYEGYVQHLLHKQA